MKYIIMVMTLTMATFLAAQENRGRDGHYHNPETGEVQPDVCDNLEANSHPCTCAHANPKCDGTDTEAFVGKQCKTWCRPKACKCETCCQEKKNG